MRTLAILVATMVAPMALADEVVSPLSSDEATSENHLNPDLEHDRFPGGGDRYPDDRYPGDRFPGGGFPGGGGRHGSVVQCTAMRGYGRTFTAEGYGYNDAEAFRMAQNRVMRRCQFSGGRGPGGYDDGYGRGPDYGGYDDGYGRDYNDNGYDSYTHDDGFGGRGDRFGRCRIVSCRRVGGGGWGGRGDFPYAGGREVIEE